MIKNILRFIRRDLPTLLTNITGLSLGLAASILLTVFIQFELSYDKHFTNADRIWRLNTIWVQNEEKVENPINLRNAYTEIPDAVAGIEECVQIYRGWKVEVTRGENRHKQIDLLYADPSFFRIFDLELLQGNPEEALNGPSNVVLSEKAAVRIFGSTDVIGESFEMDGRLFTLSGITEDVPPNTHFSYDMLLPMEAVENLEGLQGMEFFTYYLFDKEAEPASVITAIAKENKQILEKRFASFASAEFDSEMEALPMLHLHSRTNWDLSSPGNMKNIRIMIAVVITIMILALSNFVNLYILNGAKRSKEIGVRKVGGADRRGLILFFYGETTVVVTIAFILGTMIALLLVGDFGNFMQRESFREIMSSPSLYLALAGLWLLTILLSGFYPALLLSKAAPVPLIIGTVNPAGDKRVLLRIVSVFQLAIAIFLLSSLLGINSQTSYLKKLDPGYDAENILLFYNLNENLVENYPALRDFLLGIEGIEDVAASSHTIGGGASGQGIRMAGGESPEQESIAEYRVHPGLCNLYRFSLVRGRYFNREMATDRRAVILNEAAVKLLGETPESILGEQVIMHADPLNVIGVVEDFYYESAARAVSPLVIDTYSESMRCLAVRHISNTDPGKILEAVTTAIRSFDPEYNSVHRFADELYRNYYREEDRLQKIVLTGALLSVLIVLLGLYALVSHSVVSRTKEIGIRKVMGGSTSGIMRMIYFSSLLWTLMAAPAGIFLSWIYLRSWLNGYAVRIHNYWWVFLCSLVLIILFQTLITLGKSRRTARMNPVKSLRYE